MLNEAICVIDALEIKVLYTELLDTVCQNSKTRQCAVFSNISKLCQNYM